MNVGKHEKCASRKGREAPFLKMQNSMCVLIAMIWKLMNSEHVLPAKGGEPFL